MRPVARWGALALAAACLLLQRTVSQEVRGLGAESRSWRAAQAMRSLLSEGAGDRDLVAKAAAVEIAIGFPSRALSVLRERGGPDTAWDGRMHSLAGAAEYALGDYAAAGRSFARAAELLAGRQAGILLARSGDAQELSGEWRSAAESYGRAAGLVPELAPGLAVRRARTSEDTAEAALLLATAAPQLRGLAGRARGDVWLRSGDTSGAIEAYEDGGVDLKAAVLAHACGDSAAARRLAYEAAGAEDTALSRQAFEFARANTVPHSAHEFLVLAGVARRLRMRSEAVRLAGAAVSAGSQTLETLLYWGDVLAEAGLRVRAAEAYEQAARLEGSAAQAAAVKQGRTLLLLGRASAGIQVLADFASDFPDHREASRAVYALAEWHARTGRRRAADSLYMETVWRWPTDSYASTARIELAQGALDRGDTLAAMEWYGAEANTGATRRNFARYSLGTLVAARGDSVAARGIWADLASADSLGYYGTIARSAAGLPRMVVEPAAPAHPAAGVSMTLALFDLLTEAHLQEEADALMDAILSETWGSGAEQLGLAEGLIERGHVPEAVRLGWMAAGAIGLNDERVLRAVFPWPFRDLIEREAAEAGVDPHLLAALVRQESSFEETAVSRAGAQGLMQLMPATAREVARRKGVEWHDVLLSVPDANLHIGVTHLAGLLRSFSGEIVPALAAYNAGGARARRWVSAFGSSDSVQFVERIPFEETRGYLRTVLRNWALYRALYPVVEAEAAGTP